MKTADPAFAETARGLLITWARVTNLDEGIAVVWGCVDGQDGDWVIDFAGDLKRVER